MSILGKRKRFSPDQQDQLRKVTTEQFDLEIGLKKRLLDYAQARLEWAQILKCSIIEKRDNLPAVGYPPTAFRDAALATYEAIEGSCQFIVSSPEKVARAHTNGRVFVRSDSRVTEPPRTRNRLAQNSASEVYLFEDASSSTPVTLKLRCPNCSRSDFPTMQGFLNHCRLKHMRNYGTHDECIQACGVIVEKDERETLVSAGVEVKKVHLLSLKRIFERAVGLGQNEGTITPDDATASQRSNETDHISTHLSQTLGHHKDTPTLAPFLGKEVKKKVIHVYGEHDIVDVTDTEPDVASKQKPLGLWNVKERQKQNIGNEIAIAMTTLAVDEAGDTATPHAVLHATSDQGSRFHIMRRIIVSDKSLFLPSNKRPSTPGRNTHTHRWQISVSTPSYEQHVSTFLSRLTVACVTQPAVFMSLITVSKPPFVACSTTDRPFLARLTLEWVGDQNNDLIIEHWVDIDQFKTGRLVLGEEQILDVELDRNTVFRPQLTGPDVVPWTAEGDHVYEDGTSWPASNNETGNKPDPKSASEPPHIRLLRSIAPRFPVTLQELGARQTSRAPHTIYPTPAQLYALVLGRRKAIEWSRAAAIRAEYDSHVSTTSGDHVHLTTADVYRWLEREGLFPRPRPKVQKSLVRLQVSESSHTPVKDSRADPLFCSICGINIRLHVPGIPFVSGQQLENVTAGFHCSAEMARLKAPLIHLYALVAPSRVPYWVPHSEHGHIKKSKPQDLISLVHPHIMCLALHAVTSLNLSRFKALQVGSGRWISSDGYQDELKESLGPYAFLGLILEKVVRDLVGSALQVARENQRHTKIAFTVTQENTISLLTPTHVLLGLIQGAEAGGAKEALLKCFARVGTLLETARSGSGIATATVAAPAR